MQLNASAAAGIGDWAPTRLMPTRAGAFEAGCAKCGWTEAGFKSLRKAAGAYVRHQRETHLGMASKRYKPGQHCRRGRHEWTEDHGTWARCGRCGSTRQKPAGLGIADWLNLGKVNCPDCHGTGLTERGNVCSTCGGDRFLTRNEYNYLWRSRKGSSPAERLEGPL